MIKTNKFSNYIHNILYKNYEEELTQEDLKKVKKVVFTKDFGENEEILNVLNDLELLTGLESITIHRNLINDSFIKSLNKLRNLKNITFSSCEFTSNEALNTSVNILIITDSNIQDLTMIANTENLETLELLNVGNVDLEVIKKCDKVRFLYIRNSNIINFSKIYDFKNLETLKLDGSKVDDESIIDDIKDRVRFEMKDYYHLTGL